jgi:DNA-binding GntR family transcriptional regulator
MPASKHHDFEMTLYKIEGDILSGRLMPEQRLIESELMQRYRVTRGTIRKVIKELDFKQLVKHHSNRGAVVANPSKKEMEDIFRARAVLEASAVEGVIRNIDADALLRSAAYAQAFEKAFKEHNLRAMIASNRLFHQTIFDMCGNRVIAELIDQLRKRSHIWQHYIVGYPQRMKATFAQHNEILRCIKNRDAAQLKRINEEHLMEGYNNFMEDLRRSQE